MPKFAMTLKLITEQSTNKAFLQPFLFGVCPKTLHLSGYTYPRT